MRANAPVKGTRAFTVIDLMVVILTCGLVAALLGPALSKAREKSRRIGCVCNLKQIALAERIWAGDNKDRYPTQVFTNEFGGPKFADATNAFQYFKAMSNELSTPHVLRCPADRQKIRAIDFGPGFNNANVSYFIGLDADESNPNLFLAGDRNITNGAPLVNGRMIFTTNQPVGWTMELHRGVGNIAITDGSVQQITTARLRDALAGAGTGTNSLLFP